MYSNKPIKVVSSVISGEFHKMYAHFGISFRTKNIAIEASSQNGNDMKIHSTIPSKYSCRTGFFTSSTMWLYKKVAPYRSRPNPMIVARLARLRIPIWNGVLIFINLHPRQIMHSHHLGLPRIAGYVPLPIAK